MIIFQVKLIVFSLIFLLQQERIENYTFVSIDGGKYGYETVNFKCNTSEHSVSIIAKGSGAEQAPKECPYMRNNEEINKILNDIAIIYSKLKKSVDRSYGDYNLHYIYTSEGNYSYEIKLK